LAHLSLLLLLCCVRCSGVQGLLRAVEAEAEALRIIHVRIQKQLQNLEVGRPQAQTLPAGAVVQPACCVVVAPLLGSSRSLGSR
jgi:hypothetical protein